MRIAVLFNSFFIGCVVLSSCDIKSRQEMRKRHDEVVKEKTIDSLQMQTGNAASNRFMHPDKEVLRALFQPERNFASDTIYWQPDAEEIAILVENGVPPVTVYSYLDSVIYYQHANIKMAAMIFVTYDDRMSDGCHICAPFIGIAVLIQNPDNTWDLVSSRKLLRRHGENGHLKPYDVIKTGQESYALHLKYSYMATGSYIATDYLYSLHELKEILSFTSGGATFSFDEGDQRNTEFEAQMDFIYGKTDYDIGITWKGSRYDYRSDKAVEVDTTVYYYFNDFRGIYEAIRPAGGINELR